MKFTIIIPLYNCENYIEQCIMSIINTDYDLTKIQIVVVDDGSKDNSVSVVKSLQKKYENIELYSKKNGNWGSVINFVLNKVHLTGDYISILDADDACSKNYFSVWKNDGSDILVGNYYIWKNNKNHLNTIFMKLFLNTKKINHFRTAWCHPVGKFYKKELFMNLHHLKEKVRFLDGDVYHSLLNKSSQIQYTRKMIASWRSDRVGNTTTSPWTIEKTQEFVYFIEQLDKHNSSGTALLMICTNGLLKALKKYNIQINIKNKPKITWLFWGSEYLTRIFILTFFRKYFKLG